MFYVNRLELKVSLIVIVVKFQILFVITCHLRNNQTE